MADFHAADLWVAVVPETSQVGPAMEKAGQEAKGKFGDGIKGLGKKVHDELDQIGEKAKDSFSNAGKHAKDAFGKAGQMAGDAFNSEIGKELQSAIEPMARNAAEELAHQWGSKVGGFLHDQVSDALKGIGVDFDGVIDKTREFADKTRDVADSLRKLKDGDVQSGLSDVAKTLREVGGPDGNAGKAADGLDKVGSIAGKYQSNYHDLKSTIADITEGLAALTLGAPAAEGAIAAIGSAAGLVLAPLASFFGTLEIASDLTNHAQINPFGSGVPDPTKGFNSPIPAKPGVPVIPVPGMTPAAPPGYTATPGSLDPFSALLPPGMAPPSPGAAAPPSIAPPDTPDGVVPKPPAMPAPAMPPPTSTAAAPSSFGVPLMQKPDGTWTSPNPSWAHLIQRESGGINQRQKIIDANSGGNEAEGLFQITPATWRSHGGGEFAKSPLAASPQQQAIIAGRILKGNPSGSDWGAGMSGRESASGLLSGLGATGALPAGYNFYKDWYPGDSGGSGSPSGGRPSGGGYRSAGSGGSSIGPIPTGAEHDPLYVTATGPGGQSSGGRGGSPFESQGQQLGQGLINGVLEMFGLDGSVFGGKSPLDWGAVKLGGGLLNYGMGLMNSMGGGPMGAPGMSGGGGGSMLSGLAGLIPQPGAMVSAAAGPGGGSYGIKDAVGGGPTVHQNNSINIHNPSGDPYGWLLESQWAKNAQVNPPRSNGILSGVPQNP